MRRFDATGVVMMVVGAVVAYIGYKNTGFILLREEIIERWSVLIENGKGRANQIFNDTEDFIKRSEVPRIAVERKEIAPSVAKMLGITRSFLVVANFENPKLVGYKTFICAGGYGNKL